MIWDQEANKLLQKMESDENVSDQRIEDIASLWENVKEQITLLQNNIYQGLSLCVVLIFRKWPI